MRGFRTVLMMLSLWAACTPDAIAQACTTLGQTPTTALPVCGTTAFQQTTVPLCNNGPVIVPTCNDGTIYEDANPFWYRFRCFQTGTLGFVINPNSPNSDYDWQLYDITGVDANQVYTNPNLVVTGNWCGRPGPTGTSDNGVNFIHCASATNQGNTFTRMPTIQEGHEYLLLVSHYSATQAGYALNFGGGTAVITDEKMPELLSIKADCDGVELSVKLNKPLLCNSLSNDFSDFEIFPGGATVTNVVTNGCTSGFDFTEMTITLSNPLPAGDYELRLKTGTDNNTLWDVCRTEIAPGSGLRFTHVVPQPIFADSVGSLGCAPNTLQVYFPKKIHCGSINPDGSNFVITGPAPVTVSSVQTMCTGGETDIITLQLSQPITEAGLYTVTLQAGVDGNTLVDECGLQLPVHSLQFTAYNTVSAQFSYTMDLDCRNNTVRFTHDGARDVNSWIWTLNNGNPITTREHTAVLASSSTTNVKLVVSNGVCTDEATATIVLDNEVVASFEIPSVICPEDKLNIVNTSTGLVDTWSWTFDGNGSSNLKDPPPVQFPMTNREASYLIKLVASNNQLGCSDVVQKRVTVLNNCYIAVPTAFTPNGDGLNDYLFPNNAIKAQNLDFRVYNRWGQLVFETKDWTRKWDGRVGGIPQDPGVYVWFLSYTHSDTGQKVFQKGTTTLIR